MSGIRVRKTPGGALGAAARRIAAAVLLPAAIAAAAACAPLTADTRGGVTPPARFAEAPEAAGAPDLREWWGYFGDETLNRLVGLGIDRNLDIAAARIAFARAAAEAGVAKGDLAPQIALGGRAGAGRGRADTPSGMPDGSGHGYFLLGNVSASWELDFFGAKESEYDAARYRALAAKDNVGIARTETAALIASAYFEILALKENRRITEETAANLRDLRRYALGRFESGRVTAYDVDDVGNRITELEASLPGIDAGIAARARALAVLTGNTPQGFTIGDLPAGLPAKVPEAPAGIYPGELLLRRPDLLAKRAEIDAKAARVASAKADLYPRFALEFAGAPGRIEKSGDPDRVSLLGGMLGGSVVWPVFTGGKIRANIEAKSQDLKLSLAEFDEMLLGALKEVDDGYGNVRSAAAECRKLERGSAEAARLTREAAALFERGRADFDRIVDARARRLSFDKALAEGRLNRIKALISLYKALGGGWDPEGGAADADAAAAGDRAAESAGPGEGVPAEEPPAGRAERGAGAGA